MNNQNPMNFLMQIMNSGNNPQQIIDGMIKQNPQIQVVLNQMKSSGMQPKDYVMQLAKQQGVDITPMINMFNQRGIKM